MSSSRADAVDRLLIISDMGLAVTSTSDIDLLIAVSSTSDIGLAVNSKSDIGIVNLSTARVAIKPYLWVSMGVPNLIYTLAYCLAKVL